MNDFITKCVVNEEKLKKEKNEYTKFMFKHQF